MAILFKLKQRKMDEAGTDGGDAGAPAAAEPAVEPAVPAGAVDGSAALDIDDIGAMLSFDPFDQPVDDPAAPVEPAQVEGAAPAEGSPEAGVVDPATQAAAPAQPVQPEKSPEVLALEAQVAQMQQAMAQMQQPAQAPQAPAQQGGDPYAQFVPDYNFQIPQEITALLDSEDANERNTGVQQLLAASMRTTHRNILEQVNGMMASYVPQQLQMHEQQATLKTQVEQDFYGAHPALNTPEIRRLVGMVTPQVAQEMGSAAWNPQLRDTIAARVKMMLQQNPAQQPASPATQPAQFDSAARPAIPAGDNVTRDILSLM